MVKSKNYADVTGAGVSDTLSEMTMSVPLVNYLVSKREMWSTFGKMNSHLYRKRLMDKMKTKKLAPESMLMIWAMASVIKSQPRIIQAMDDTPEPERFAKPEVWFAVKDFFQTECTQYVSASKKNKKFPVVNIPTTMPGLDILFFCLTTENEERTMENLKIRPTFSQMFLQADVQTVAKEGYAIFWNSIIKGTRNEDKVEKPEMREEYYRNSEADKYVLLSLDPKAKIIPFPMTLVDKGYSREEVETYLRIFDTYASAPT
jgi:hypothetical protein